MNWYKRALKEYEKLKDGESYLGTPWPKYESKPDNYKPKDKWIPVDSSFISHVAYYAPLKTFEVKLKDGNIYNFSGVSRGVFAQFMKAKSKGEFFNRVIKPRYRQTK